MIIEWDEECQSCKGTGLYVGVGMHDGAAVVCRHCEGTGCFHFKHRYVPFAARRPREGVVRVFQTGWTSGGGIPYLSWWNGESFPPGSEDREHTCPCEFYQYADSERKPQWAECGWGRFSDCKQFPEKRRCWERFDKEGL